MANLFKQLSKLKTNIFGGPGNTGHTKPPASRVKGVNLLENTPTDSLFQDPLSVSTFSYPMDVQQNFQNGHYMLFYVNVQEKTKYRYKSNFNNDEGDSIDIGDYKQKAMYNKLTDDVMYVDGKGANASEVAYRRKRNLRAGRHINESRFLKTGALNKDAKKGP